MQSAKDKINELKDQIKAANYTSPINGKVSEIKMIYDNAKGVDVEVGQKIAVISNSNDMGFWFLVEENYIPHLKINMPVEIQLDANPSQKYKGKIIEMGTVKINEKENNLNENMFGRENDTNKIPFEIKKYQVKVKIDDSAHLEEKKKGSVTIVFNKKDNVINIPLNYLMHFNDQYYVLTAKNNSPSTPRLFREVEVGAKSFIAAEIKSGLQEGEYVFYKE